MGVAGPASAFGRAGGTPAGASWHAVEGVDGLEHVSATVEVDGHEVRDVVADALALLQAGEPQAVDVAAWDGSGTGSVVVEDDERAHALVAQRRGVNHGAS